MIRAHLATFPPRRRLVRKTCDAILPQVGHLFVVLNDYDEVPGFLAKNPKVTAIIPDRDVKDAGKFWFTPAPDDIVFTIDDDIGDPTDYVTRTLAHLDTIGPEGSVGGYQANVCVGPRGSSIPPLSEIEPNAGARDIPFCAWLFRRGILPWTLPRKAGWLLNELPRNLRPSSLFQTVARKGHAACRGLMWSFATRWPHADIRHDRFAARPA